MDKTFIIHSESGLFYNWKAIAADPSANHQPLMDLVAYKALYVNKIAQARGRGLEPVLVSLPIIDANRFFAHITRGMSIFERTNILYWLGGNIERLRNLHDMYNLALFRVASTQCVHIVDITSPMLAEVQFDRYLNVDGFTLSVEGENLIQNVLAKAQINEAA